MMKVLICVDMEGISGITKSEQVLRGDPEYQHGRQYMAWDTNACVEGCFRGGATQVVVRDAHASGFNMLWEQIDSRAELTPGTGGRDQGRLFDVGQFDAMSLLGYHAMAGTPEAVLEHTMSSGGWQNFWLNGKKAGEIAMDAGIAGDDGVPTIMVSGCDKACAEAKKWIKGVYTACVKKGLAWDSARLLGKEVAHKLISDTAEKACRNYKKVKPLVHAKPVRMRLELVERGKVPSPAAGMSYLKIVDARTYEVTGATTREALSRL
ncbi:MAG TPA: M55 family metallopeptidase [Phycisphaerae bacterium]|nr:M55 family metallopeptidase [Phycisphaerae bacterium]